MGPVGVISGAHINPMVTLAFQLEGRLRRHVALGMCSRNWRGASSERFRFGCGVRRGRAFRSLGPGIVAGEVHGWWIYWLEPLAGTLAAVGLRRAVPVARSFEIRVAKVFHFRRDPHGMFTEKSAPSQRSASGQ